MFSRSTPPAVWFLCKSIFWTLGLQLVSEKRLLYMCFHVNFGKFIFFIEHLEMAGNILKSQWFYRSILVRNVHRFHFLQGMFLHTPVFLKRALLWLENYHEFSRFSRRVQLHRSQDTKHNVLDLADFRNQAYHRKFLRE